MTTKQIQRLTDEDAYVIGRGKRFMRVVRPIHKPAPALRAKGIP